MDACPIAATVCALILGGSACIIVRMTTLARIQVARTQLEIAKIEGHYAKQRREHLPPVVTAWLLLLLGAGGSCGLIGWDRQRAPEEVAANIRTPAKPNLSPAPGPVPEPPRACSECPKCPCKNKSCNCTAESEKKPGIRADLVLPPGTSTAVNPFGEPWPRMTGAFVSPRL